MMNTTGLVTAHLNAPYGRIVSEKDLARSFRAGCVVAADKAAEAIIAQIFIEVEPRLVVQCAREIGVPLAKVDALYHDALAHGAPACPAWEKAVEHLV